MEQFFREILQREVQKEKKLFTKDFAKAFRHFRKWINSECVPALKNSPLFISSKDLFNSIKFHSISSDYDLTGSAGNGSIFFIFKKGRFQFHGWKSTGGLLRALILLFDIIFDPEIFWFSRFEEQSQFSRLDEILRTRVENLSKINKYFF